MKLLTAKAFDWEKLEKLVNEKSYSFEQQRKVIIKATNKHFKKMSKQDLEGEMIDRVVPRKVKGKKIVGADANLMGLKPVFLVSYGPDAPDRGYEAIFKEYNMRSSTNNTFELLKCTGGVTYKQVAAGESAELTPVPASSVTNVSELTFIGGYTILDKWLRFNLHYKLDQLVEEAADSWWEDKATIFYGLLTALPAGAAPTGIDWAFNTSIAKTINTAIVDIIAKLKAKKVRRVNSHTNFVITCNEADRYAILEALTATFGTPNANRTPVIYNIKAVIPTSYVAAGYFYISVPDGENGQGEWEDFYVRPAQRDELKLGADYVWTGMYNAIIGEQDQHRRCAVSA